MNKWWWAVGGAAVGYFLLPKVVAMLPVKLPGGGR